MLQCQLVHVQPLLKALCCLNFGRDPWVTIVFTQERTVLHTASDDQSMTATATVPNSVFSAYECPESTRVMVSTPNIIDAVTMMSGASMGGSGVKVLLAYPTSDDRFLVEAVEDDRSSRTALLVRAVKERLLDLRFRDALVTNRVMIKGDVLRDMVADLLAFQCENVALVLTAKKLGLVGLRSPHGNATIEIEREAEGVLHFEVSDESVQPRYHISHLALAVGLTQMKAHAHSKFGFTAPGAAQYAVYVGGGISSESPAFENLFLQLNTESQLLVTHQGARAHDAEAQVNFTVNPLAVLDDI